MAGLRRALHAGLGLPRAAHRAPDREEARPPPRAATRRARSAAPTPPSRSSGRRPTSAAWACWATGSTRTRRWISRPRPTRSARSRASGRRACSTAASSPSTGASTAPPRSPRRKSNTRTRPRAAIDVAFAAADPAALARAFGVDHAAGARLRGHLDHHAVDAAGQPGDRRAPRPRVRARRHGARRAHPRRRPCATRAWSATASRRKGVLGRAAGRRAGGPRASAIPFERARRADDPRRARDARGGHRASCTPRPAHGVGGLRGRA